MILKILAFTIGTYCYQNPPPKKYTEYTARVTYYWNDPITATGKKTVCGYTIAVDPSIIPYNSIVTIPELKQKFVAHDTGPAVVKRTASKRLGKNNIVIDIYCKDRKVAQQRIKKNPMFMKIRVHHKKK
jgi:3D (Asp-Asp-Asp) domain-containing protein